MRYGNSTESTIHYNASRGELFAPFVNKIRAAPKDYDMAALGAERAKFDFLSGLDYKFINYAKSSLMGDEKVMQTVWQPAIRVSFATLLSWSLYRTISPAHMLILTDMELILIRDDERIREIKGVRNGGIWLYIPLSSIVRVSLSERQNALLSVSIDVTGSGRVNSVFEASRKPQLIQLQNEMRKMNKRIDTPA
jgi:hypothetical protein